MSGASEKNGKQKRRCSCLSCAFFQAFLLHALERDERGARNPQLLLGESRSENGVTNFAIRDTLPLVHAAVDSVGLVGLVRIELEVNQREKRRNISCAADRNHDGEDELERTRETKTKTSDKGHREEKRKSRDIQARRKQRGEAKIKRTMVSLPKADDENQRD
uniref:Uncharacterized protein n=1 Tax=Toxoplasma gondii COUG TaxID=1074873 RepID=A0A2G8XSJ5_TOXGO|nr:hypothetical protein TGCOUG_394960 [Toxoplasma gondii COUG]